MKITVDLINKAAESDPVGMIAESEKQYYKEIREMADEISSNPANKIIMLAGPSSSGKTTTAHILCDCLTNMGKSTQVVSLDDFYLNRADAPRGENGRPDYETVHALDIPEIARCFKSVITDGECMMPQFDFTIGARKENRKKIDVSNGGLLIVEGLHALNPLLSDHLPDKNLFKVYISVNQYIYNTDGSVALSSRQMRLVRRMSRDSIYRNSSAQQTYDMWSDVVKGEHKYLYQFKSSADRTFSTLHLYEPCVFRNIALSMLESIDIKSDNYSYVKDTIDGLKQFIPIDESLVPDDSLIREFIKGGKYENI